MSLLSALEISIRHGVCAEPGCAICNEMPIATIAQYLHQLGFHVLDFSDDHKSDFGFIHVREDDRVCSILLRKEISR